LAGIAETFGLHELAVEDAVKSHQRPKVERYGEMIFCALRTARYVEHEELTESSEVVDTGDMMMFIGDHYIITVRHGDACRLGQVREQLGPARRSAAARPVGGRVRGLRPGGRRVPRRRRVDGGRHRRHRGGRVRPGRSGGSRHRSNRIQRIYQLKRELMEFKRAVLPLQRPLSGLVNREVIELPKEIRRYFRDVLDHLNRASEQVVYFDDLLNSILQARLAQVSVDQNNDMRKIAAWAGIAAVWTAIAGVYG
jgi:magnesium transporter